MITLFRKQYVDNADPSKGFTSEDYFMDPEVGFFPRIGRKHFCLDYDEIDGVVELPTTPLEWKISQRNAVEYCSIGIDKPERSLKPINLEHAHIMLQFRCEVESGKVLTFMQEALGHKKFKLIACKGTSEECNDYCRAIGKYGGVDNPERKNSDGLPNPGRSCGVMSNHEPKRSRQGKSDDSVAEIHQYISDHALDPNLDMFVFFAFSDFTNKKLTRFSLVRTYPQVLPHRAHWMGWLREARRLSILHHHRTVCQLQALFPWQQALLNHCLPSDRPETVGTRSPGLSGEHGTMLNELRSSNLTSLRQNLENLSNQPATDVPVVQDRCVPATSSPTPQPEGLVHPTVGTVFQEKPNRKVIWIWCQHGHTG